MKRVASVSQNGVVNAVFPGNAKITARVMGSITCNGNECTKGITDQKGTFIE